MSLWAFAVVWVLICGAAMLLWALIEAWWEQRRAKRANAPRELTGTDWANYDPTDEEQGGLPDAWAQSRRDEQARTRRNDTQGAGQ